MVRVEVNELIVPYDKEGHLDDGKAFWGHQHTEEFDAEHKPPYKGLFRKLQADFGKFSSHIHKDSDPGKKFGWVFARREEEQHRDGSVSRYIRESWVHPLTRCEICCSDVEGDVGWD